MTITSKKTNRFFLFFNIVILFFIFFMEIYISRYGTLFADDIDYGIIWDDENIWDLLFKNAGKVHGGGYINIFLTKFLCWELPALLNIHPMDFALFPMCVIKAIIVVLFCFFTSLFSKLFSKSNGFQIINCILISLVFFAEINFVHLNNNMLNFLRFTLSMTVFSIFWLYIFKSILRKTPQKNYLKFLIICVISVILGSNLEICIFVSIITALFIILYNLSCKFIKKLKPFNLNYQFFTPVIILILTAIWYIHTDGFSVIANERGLKNIIITIDILKEFLFQFWLLYIVNYSIYWIIFFALIILGIKIALKTKNLKRFLLPIFVQFALIIVVLSLILCGKTLYGSGKFWLENNIVIMSFKTISLINMSLLTGYIMRYYKKLKIFFFLIYLVICIHTVFHINDNALFEQKQTKEIREINYIYDKLYQFYYIKNKKPIVPEDRQNPYYGWKDYKGVTAAYLKRVYNHKLDYDSFEVIIDENALDKYKKEGGVLTKEELTKIKFSRLRNKNFILNK